MGNGKTAVLVLANDRHEVMDFSIHRDANVK
jgi:hypothetical protein